MTTVSLVTAVAVGLVIGLASLITSSQIRRNVPIWLPAAVGIGTAMLATLIAQMTDPGRAGLTTVELILQVTFPVAGLAVVAVTARRHPPVTHRSNRTESIR
ncbi:hypothetical protein [Actinoplanes awajinensis]|uniref:Uncharacterized protein n=1 Tax=Actinoplanes awajinensis subsp. mycoplanecinus TaxID=135947 RepID=A0A101J9T9_9ACTN|nr:hypothetical protein [Actinoplanes awajinensis]KUL22817.1 hypothetical protein ADL15_47365 [Actinoplanes awajinensis subsp. mycoplanecinus]